MTDHSATQSSGNDSDMLTADIDVERKDTPRWRRYVKPVVIVAALAVGARIWLAPTPDVFAQGPDTLDAAIATAQSEHKPVVAVATSDFCAACQIYKRSGLANSRVQAWLKKNTVPFFMRIEWDGADAKRVGRANGPVPATMVLVDGEIVAQFAGPLGAEDLLAWLKANARVDDEATGNASAAGS